VHGHKRKIHKEVAEFYLLKNVVARRLKQKFRSRKYLLRSAAGDQVTFPGSERSRGPGGGDWEKGGRHKE
jgi:hypothetical protein